MVLEAVWFKNGKEVYKVSPVVNLVSYEDMEEMNDIEVFDGNDWHSCIENKFEANDFEIRIKSESKKKKKS